MTKITEIKENNVELVDYYRHQIFLKTGPSVVIGIFLLGKSRVRQEQQALFVVVNCS